MDYQRLFLDRCDPDQLSDVIDGSDMQHRVLPGGALRVDVEVLRPGTGVLQRGHYGMGVLVNGAWPRGLITVGIVLGAPAHLTVNGFACPALSVQLYSEGSELDYRAPPGSTWFAYCIERECIQEAAVRLSGQPLAIPNTGAVNIQPEPTDGRRIVTLIRGLFTLGAHPATPQRSLELEIDSLVDQFHYVLARTLLRGQARDSSWENRRVVRRRRLISQAEDYLRANISEPFRLSEFARAVQVSPRTLESRFLETYGVTPKTWFRSMKLNAVRQELKRSHGADQRIGDVAMRWGFLHLGRFSEEYRRLFRERPKDTLRR